jgi:dTDP-D-glucose 4,6-dehydratase
VLALSYTLILALVAGSRLLKSEIIKRYDIVERRGPVGNGIRRVLVVGGAGYIGSVLVRQLLNAGYNVRVLDAVIFGNSAVQGLCSDSRFELMEGDLRHVESVVRAARGSDAVIHLGAIVGDPACALNEGSTRDVNTVATKLLIQVCRGIAEIAQFLEKEQIEVFTNEVFDNSKRMRALSNSFVTSSAAIPLARLVDPTNDGAILQKVSLS